MSIDDRVIDEIGGTAVPILPEGLVSDVDTDQITPSDAMKEPSFATMGGYLFRDARANNPNHPFNLEEYDRASIMIVGANFGSGSSRETAPQAIKQYGIDAVVGESYLPIFAGNCATLGIPLVTASRDDLEVMRGRTVSDPTTSYRLDLRKKTITVPGDSSFPVVKIDLPEGIRTSLLNGTWDPLDALKANQPKVNRVLAGLPYLDGFKGH